MRLNSRRYIRTWTNTHFRMKFVSVYIPLVISSISYSHKIMSPPPSDPSTDTSVIKSFIKTALHVGHGSLLNYHPIGVRVKNEKAKNMKNNCVGPRMRIFMLLRHLYLLRVWRDILRLIFIQISLEWDYTKFSAITTSGFRFLHLEIRSNSTEPYCRSENGLIWSTYDSSF